jgi:hypothetical protein
MCELLIYARNDGPDEALHPMQYRVGDVVDAKPDGAVWGTSELCPDSSFRVVVFPGVNVSEAHFLLVEEDHDDLSNLGRPGRRRRTVRFHHTNDNLPHGFVEWWAQADGTRFVMDGHSLTSFVIPHPIWHG